MTTITLTPDQVASVLAQQSGKPAASPVAPSADTPVVATWTAFGYKQYDSGNLPAGSTFAVAVDVADTDSGVAVYQFGQSGTLGGSFKDVVISDAPGKFDGIVIGKNLNSASLIVGHNYPTAGANMTPGRWYINVRLRDAGGAIVIKSTQ